MTQERILVVEDEVIVARTIVSQLNQLGYTVIGTAASGNAAITRALETKPELVLMDIVLKGEMDGVTAAAQIREQLNVPVIYLTAYADETTLQRAKLTEPFGYIVKPFTANDLRVGVEMGLYKHRVEQDLRESRDQLSTLLRSMHDAVIATDARGAVTYMNPAAELLTGWTQTDALGKTVTDILQLVDEVTDTPAIHPVEKVLQERQVVRLNDYTALINRAGVRIPIGDTASPLQHGSGEISGVVMVFWDTTDRRQTELLTQALAKEQELSRLRSQFIATASHEFRNPLAVIRTAAELLERQGSNLSDAKRLAYFRRIKDSVQLMNQLMEEVLFMGRAEADRLDFNPVMLNVDYFCRDLIDELLIDENSPHAVHFSNQGDDVMASVDERLLRYILLNLLMNAIKYSPDGGTIQLTLAIAPTINQIQFQVADQGIGIPEVDQPHLFESFYRASNAGTIQGTGLGLAIVKRRVDAHHGDIQVSSTIGTGTTVTVTLPLQSEAFLSGASAS